MSVASLVDLPHQRVFNPADKMWTHQKAPRLASLGRQNKQIMAPLKKFSTWELVEHFKEWLRVLRYSRSAQESYARGVGKFCVFLGSKPLSKVTHHDVKSFLIEATRRDVSVQCANRFLGGLKSFFDFLYLGGIVDSVAPRFIRGRGYRHPLPRVVSEENIRKLIRAAGSARNKAIIELMYATGCRAGEIVAMKVEDIDFARLTILVRGKGGERTVYFGGPAKRALRKYLGVRRKGVVFLTENLRQRGGVYCSEQQWTGYWRDYTQGRDMVRTRSKYLGPRTITRREALRRFKTLVPDPTKGQKERKQPISLYVIFRVFRFAAHRAGLGRITSHQMRHSFATHLLDRGANVRQVQQFLGHSSLNTTQTYTRVSTCDLGKAYRRFHPRR